MTSSDKLSDQCTFGKRQAVDIGDMLLEEKLVFSPIAAVVA